MGRAAPGGPGEGPDRTGRPGAGPPSRARRRLGAPEVRGADRRRAGAGGAPDLARSTRVVVRVLLVAVLFVGVVLWLRAGSGGAAPPAAWRAQIVSTARSQLGRQTDPPGTYCNPYSGYWASGVTTCAAGDRAEPWCADFAAWAWHQAHVPFTYGYDPGQINAGAISFYRWGVAHGTWHPVGSGYRPQPGDVAVYGLDTSAGRADHVAVVIRQRTGERGPDVINGDGDRTAFSIVEIGRDQTDADTAGVSSPLAGYVAPVAP